MRNLRQFLLLVCTIALFALPFLVWWKAQALTDWWQLRNYTPPTVVADLATQDTMNDYSRHVFYVNHPDIQSNVSQFRSDCKENEKTIILGCYHSNQAGIFMYDVTDQRLSGIEQVTAAHEMLHAAYDRLSSKERKTVNVMLQDYYLNQLKDQRVIDTINSYKESEPNDILNEVHSILGTEVPNLPTALENYYKQYFTNRAAVTNFAASYENEFTSREDQINQIKTQLDQLKLSIDQKESDLDTMLKTLNSDKARLDGLRSSNRIQEYNSQVAGYNREVEVYNYELVQLKAAISQYNQLVDTYNSIAKELASLTQSIDTRLQTQAAQ